MRRALRSPFTFMVVIFTAGGEEDIGGRITARTETNKRARSLEKTSSQEFVSLVQRASGTLGV
ncbi:hypothetical protein DAETH_08570 [Deinococcus aetherius]|uniref:Secreted protein n=1 Tax=Deinococcus aetherius TaxID=200252 RepID=A0ABM8ABA3_9DEIO|nr:hypothetical protein DAETH_08570 [Deinococcus aetherius]